MKKPTNEKPGQVEVNNLPTPTDHGPLSSLFGEDEKVAYETLRKELTKGIRPVLPRVVRKSD